MEVDDLKAQLEQANNTIKEKNKQLEEMNKAMEEMKMEKESLQEQLNENQEYLDGVKKDRKSEFKEFQLLQKESKLKDKQIEQKDEQIRLLTQMLDMQQAINNLTEKNEALLKLVDDSAKTLAFQRRVKDKSLPNPNYIEGIDNGELVREYVENGYRLTSDISQKYIDKYGITYNGLRMRLKKLGVWKSTRA